MDQVGGTRRGASTIVAGDKKPASSTLMPRPKRFVISAGTQSKSRNGVRSGASERTPAKDAMWLQLGNKSMLRARGSRPASFRLTNVGPGRQAGGVAEEMKERRNRPQKPVRRFGVHDQSQLRSRRGSCLLREPPRPHCWVFPERKKKKMLQKVR